MSDRRAGAATRLLRLAARTREAADILSLRLEAADGAPLWPFEAGQHLPIELPTQPGARPLLRTYTISSPPSATDHYRLTVKREPGGAASGWLHDALALGDALAAHPPRGRFVAPRSERPIVMLSGGVGLTPFVSMLADLADRADPRELWFLHACRDAAHQALGPEVRALAARHGRARVVVFHESAAAGPGADAIGRVDRAALRRLLPLDGYDFLLCGPTGFMDALTAILLDIGAPPERIARESFGARAETPAPPPRKAAGPRKATGPRVRFQRSGREARWSDPSQSLLDLALASGVDAVYSCREGVCGTCRCRLVSGDIAYAGEPVAWCEPGEILTCLARPKGDVTLDL